MAATVSTDFVFEPKVWQDHVRAYFDDRLVFGAIALRDETLVASPGETINFPYFDTIGAVEEPLETASLTVDNLSDDSFSATVKEVGKAVGVKKKAFKVSAARTERIIMEITSQMGRRHAEKIDDDLLAEMNNVANHVAPAALGAGATISKIMSAKVAAFGDHHRDSVAIQIPSLLEAEIMTDTATGILKADATDPMIGAAGFAGRMLGMAVFVSDKVPANSAFLHKVNPYGFIVKQDMEMESDYDILAREHVFTSNEWYAVKSFHGKVDALDLKSAKLSFV